MATPEPGSRPRRAARGLQAAALLGAAALLLTACGGNSPSAAQNAADDGKPVQGGTLTYAEVTPITTFQTQAARFYEKQGWTNVGTVLHRVDTPNGEYQFDVWRFEKKVG